MKQLVLSGSLQWIIGRSVSRVCEIFHVNGNKLLFPENNGVRDSLPLIENNKQSFLPLSCFPKMQCGIPSLCGDGAMIGNVSTKLTLDETVRLIDKVYR